MIVHLQVGKCNAFILVLMFWTSLLLTAVPSVRPALAQRSTSLRREGKDGTSFGLGPSMFWYSKL
jgi:hypothetical protein